MKYIHKSSPPRSLTRWREENRIQIRSGEIKWNDFDSEVKRSVHQSLMDEQGYICCYCGERIGESTAAGNRNVRSDIEHLKPQERYPRERFSYGNLMASCLGGATDTTDRRTKAQLKHCNGKKGDWYDSRMVSPLTQDCEVCFTYTLDGEIISSEDSSRRDDADLTIDQLNLNSRRLIRLRDAVIDEIMNPTVDSGDIDLQNEQQLISLIERYNEKDDNGRYERFSAAIVNILRQKLAL